MAKRITATIVYSDYSGRQFEKSITGTQREIEAEADRMRSLPDVASVYVEY